MTCRCGECYDLVITNKAVSDYVHEAAKRFNVSFTQATTTFQNIVTCLVESDKIQLSLEYENATPQDATEIKEWIEFLIEENKQQQDILGWNDLEILTRNNIVIAKNKKNIGFRKMLRAFYSWI